MAKRTSTPTAPRTLPAALLGFGLVLAGCSEPDVQPVGGGPPVSGVVAPDPRAIEWAEELCTTLDPVFTAVEPLPEAADLEGYRERLAAARAAVDGVTPALTDVGPAPSDEGQTIIERVDGRLERLAADLAAAAVLVEAVDGTDPVATEEALSAARAALGSFDRVGLAPLLQPDPAVRNALPFAPTCVGAG